MEGAMADLEPFAELRDTGKALSTLAENEGAFARVLEAFRKGDVEGVRKALDQAKLLPSCILICRWLCIWRCIRVCRIVCKTIPEKDLVVPQLRELAAGLARLAANDALLKRLLQALDKEDAQAFGAIVDELKLGPYCYYVCHWLCFIRCRLFCDLICSPPVAGVVKHLEEDVLAEVRETGKALGRLAEEEGVFTRATDAFRKGDVEAFRRVLDLPHLIPWCFLICRWFCIWRCVRVCRLLCKTIPEKEPTIPELREYAQLVARLTADDTQLRRLTDAVEREDVQTFGAVIEQFKLGRFCYFLCHWVCYLHCGRFCRLVCPPIGPLPLWRYIGVLNYLTQIDSAPGGNGLTLADKRAFHDTIRLNGVLYQKLLGSAMEYRFEVRALPAVAWTPVLPAQIVRTKIGSWSRFTGNLLDPTEIKEYTVNGTPGPNEVTVIPAVDGWIKVPQEDNYWNTAGPGLFTPNGDMLRLDTRKLMAWTDINVAGVTAGQTMPPAGLGQDVHFAIRLRVRKVGNAASEMTAGECHKLAIYDRNYDNVTHGGSWAPQLMPDELGVVMVNILEIGGGCGGITNALTVKYTAAHPNLGAVSLSITGPGVPPPPQFTLADSAGATPQNRFGNGTPTFAVAPLQKCAYIVKLTAEMLLTTGDSNPLPVQDEIAFCK